MASWQSARVSYSRLAATKATSPSSSPRASPRQDSPILRSDSKSAAQPTRNMTSWKRARANSSPLAATKALTSPSSSPRAAPLQDSPILRPASAPANSPEKGHDVWKKWFRKARSALVFVVTLQVSRAGRGQREADRRGQDMPLSALSSNVPRDPIVRASSYGKRLPGVGARSAPPILFI